MAWLRIDDRVRTHPKVVQAGPQAAWVWFCGICYCREHLTDGVIPAYILSALTPGVNSKKYAAKLVEVGLWHRRDDGSYEIHDFLDWNPSRSDIEASKEWDRRRKGLYADPALIKEIRERDQDQCRYCAVPVNWRDRRGPTGGQFDYVTPRGPNTRENIVVSCRRCNLRKNDRTPAEAGMSLRPVTDEAHSSTENQIGSSSHSTEESSSPRARTPDAGLGFVHGSGSSGSRSGNTTNGTPAADGRGAWFWAEWRRAIFNATQVSLTAEPKAGEIPVLVELLAMASEADLLRGLDRFTGLSSEQARSLNIKALSLGYFRMALPRLLQPEPVVGVTARTSGNLSALQRFVAKGKAS